MKLVFAVSTILLLAACGVDGEPVYPTASNVVSLSNSGVSASTNLSVNQGPVTVAFGVGL